MRKSLLFICTGVIALFACSKDQGSPETAVPDKYFPKVRAIIQNNCTISCHAPSHGFYDGMPVILESDTDIVNHAAGIKAALTGPFSFMNKQMPLGGTLSAADINTIVQWVGKGGTSNVCGLNQ